MTEYEIVFLMSEYVNRTWEIIQIWTGISFGLMALTHFSSKYLNLVIVLAASVSYVAFSFFAMTIFKMNGAVVNGFLIDLAALQASGATLAEGTKIYLEEAPGPLAYFAIIAVFFTTFFASLIFLWWSFLTGRKSKS